MEKIAAVVLAARVVTIRHKRGRFYMDYKLFHSIDEVCDQEKSIEIVKEEIYDLWQECFHDSDSYTDFYMQWKVKGNQVLTMYKDGKLSSMLHLNPYNLMVYGTEIPANYIVGVATRKKDRRQGLMKSLLEAALHQMYLQHMPFTYLMPAAEAIYRPFGFQTVYTQSPWNQYYKQAGQRVHGTSLSEDINANLTILSLEKDDDRRMEELSLYTNHLLSKRYDIYTHRTSYYYERLVHEMESTGGKVLLCYQGQELVGYLAFMADGGIYIAEYLTEMEEESFLYALHGYISENDSKVRAAQVSEEEQKLPRIMTRIVDLTAFVRLLSSETEQKLIIEVRDSVLKDNNGVFELAFNSSKAGGILTRTTNEPEISVDIADLTALVFGTLSEEEITSIICSNAKKVVRNKLNHIITLGNLFINDVV